MLHSTFYCLWAECSATMCCLCPSPRLILLHLPFSSYWSTPGAGTSRFKQFSGTGSHKAARGNKRSRGGGGGTARGGGRRGSTKAGSPGLHADSDSDPESVPDMSASEAEEVEEVATHRTRRRSLSNAPAAAVPAAAAAAEPAAGLPAPAAAAAAVAAEDGRRTTSGRTVRPPRSRLGEAAAVTSPELAAAEAAQLAEYEVAEAMRRQHLPTLPPHISLFKSAPVAPPAAAPHASSGGGAGAAAAALLLQLPPVGSCAPPASQVTLSASSDLSAYNQPGPAAAQPTTAASVQLPSGMAAGLPSYGVPLPGLAAHTTANGWPTGAAAQQHWAALPPPRYADVPQPLPGPAMPQ